MQVSSSDRLRLAAAGLVLITFILSCRNDGDAREHPWPPDPVGLLSGYWVAQTDDSDLRLRLNPEGNAQLETIGQEGSWTISDTGRWWLTPEGVWRIEIGEWNGNRIESFLSHKMLLRLLDAEGETELLFGRCE